MMSNYFSIGSDANVGVNFDKVRKKSRQMNRCLYCWLGFIKTFSRNPKITKTLESVELLTEGPSS